MHTLHSSAPFYNRKTAHGRAERPFTVTAHCVYSHTASEPHVGSQKPVERFGRFGQNAKSTVAKRQKWARPGQNGKKSRDAQQARAIRRKFFGHSALRRAAALSKYSLTMRRSHALLPERDSRSPSSSLSFTTFIATRSFWTFRIAAAAKSSGLTASCSAAPARPRPRWPGLSVHHRCPARRESALWGD